MPSFIADERNLGGVHQILDTYNSHHSKLFKGPNRPASAPATRSNNSQLSMAQVLSINRAKRRAAVDLSAVNHVNNIYHMNRHIEEACRSSDRRRQQSNDSYYRPSPPSTPTTIYSRLIKDQMDRANALIAEGFIGGGAKFDGRSTSAQRSLNRKSIENRHFAGSISNGVVNQSLSNSLSRNATNIDSSNDHPDRHLKKNQGDEYVGWSVRESDRNILLTNRYTAVQRCEDYHVYREALTQEVVKNRIYRSSDLRRLFRSFFHLAPVHDKDTVQAVITDLKEELDVY
eukprot:CAMPEP_0175055518 /NCGR_PEP_ID=MMETSP0052_2-20121109/10130_1 /TAXON_ID=51329 ORGANISM="Polytomella parva, Strain SAG 63-3" /NCGR_SAMPLE_ID=MMETSP0052_2 /ASSEMBLY_ACC=CAM_ASM_000194 /LENGTH=286 /DNA_ID=CAMNT_0016320383 /DNA_START=245 /DNA_END=1105 /DNA_ORIENTATION=-